MAAAVADADIDIFAREIDQPGVGADADVDFGIGALEAAEPRHHPLHGERRVVVTVRCPPLSFCRSFSVASLSWSKAPRTAGR